MTPGEGGFGPDTIVWRRIPPHHFPKKPRQDRPDSAAFDDDSPDEPMSVVIARSGRDPSDILRGHDGFGVVALTGAELEAAGQRLQADPLPGEPDHALVIGRKSKGQRRQLASSAEWVVRPPDAYPPLTSP